MTYRICFVCLGNICRSPMAETVMRSALRDAGLAQSVEVSSAGTGDWHIGERADPRAVAVLDKHGYDASGHRARQFVEEMFVDYDLVVALDSANMATLRRLAPAGEDRKVRLLMSFVPAVGVTDVPDPYYGGPDGFDEVLALIDSACARLLDEVRVAVAG
jgi:low molecular weight protein-tyrosine phosphatase